MISFTVHAFKIEGSSKCRADRLEYYNGADLDITPWVFCGFARPDIPISTSNAAVLIFLSDTRAEFSGFSLVYTSMNASVDGLVGQAVQPAVVYLTSTFLPMFTGNQGFLSMMTSSNGSIFRVTGPLCGEFTGHRWIPLTKASDAELWCFLWSAPK